jgi:hypothetical protein
MPNFNIIKTMDMAHRLFSVSSFIVIPNEVYERSELTSEESLFTPNQNKLELLLISIMIPRCLRPLGMTRD